MATSGLNVEEIEDKFTKSIFPTHRRRNCPKSELFNSIEEFRKVYRQWHKDIKLAEEKCYKIGCDNLKEKIKQYNLNEKATFRDVFIAYLINQYDFKEICLDMSLSDFEFE